MNNLTVQTEDTFVSLLELAANNDFEAFKLSIERGVSGIDEVSLWYGRREGSKQMVLEHRTPLMVAATYGSIDVVELILSRSDADVNRRSGRDQSTALHCAASGGSMKAVDIVKLLLDAGADPNSVDANGNCPVDVISVPPKWQDCKSLLEVLLASKGSVERSLKVSIRKSESISPPLFPSPESKSPASPLGSNSPSKFNEVVAASSFPERREYPIDPSLPDIKNGIYSTDEFRMFSFKVRPCSRAYSHDWTECPFVHPGENARRRDPRKYHYSCVPCPDFRKGACRRGDMCEYAHGVFECWLHPAQYRTRLCKDGTSCNRRVCFFAHTQEELRPLYVSTGSAVPSPRSGSNAMDFAAAMSLLPGSPSSVSGMSPSQFTPPMSPSANGMSNMGWPQPNIPALHLPGSNFQSSRLRSSFNARDEFDLLQDLDEQQQFRSEFSRQILNRSIHSKTLTPSNLEDIFSVESSSSPRYSDQALTSAVFSPTHKSAVFNQFQQQQNMMSPINTNFSPKAVDHSLLQSPFGGSSSGRMSPRGLDPVSPMSSRVSLLAREKQQHQFRSLSSRDLGANCPAMGGSPGDPWSKLGSLYTKVDWAVGNDDLGRGRLRRSSSFENREGPDFSWLPSLMTDPDDEMIERQRPVVSSLNGGGATSAVTSSADGANMNSSSQTEPVDQSALSAWLEQIQLDQLMAQ